MNFGEWIVEQMAIKGISNNAELARRGGFQQSLVKRWLTATEQPKANTMRSVALALDMPLLQVMVAAGYLSAAEANIVEIQADLAGVGDEQLMREVKVRIARSSEPSGSSRK